MRRRSKTRDSDITAESCTKLRAAEARLNELKTTMRALGREATAAMSSVEDQQQEVTLQRLFTMVLQVIIYFLCAFVFALANICAQPSGMD